MARNLRPDSPDTQGRTKHDWKKINEMIASDVLLYSLIINAVIIREASAGSKLEQLQRLTDRHYVERV